MAYEAKTNWKLDDTVMPDDMNRIEQGIKDVELELEDAGGVIILEASINNILDFNTLIESGIYLIKNATDTATSNKPSNIGDGDIFVTVGTFNGIVYQTCYFGVNFIPKSYYRYYTPINSSWGAWEYCYVPPSQISIGTLPTGMKCDTPTADTHITNKLYVDTQVATKATITYGTTDLTAGTSTLTTGNIHLVYE